jgi:hypothetical protein
MPYKRFYASKEIFEFKAFKYRDKTLISTFLIKGLLEIK